MTMAKRRTRSRKRQRSFLRMADSMIAWKMRSITNTMAPLMMTGLFSYYLSPARPMYFPGASFFAAGLFTIAALILVSWMIRHARIVATG